MAFAVLCLIYKCLTYKKDKMMGISPRVHFFDEQNTLHKIPYSKFDRLLNGDKSVSFIKFKAQKIRCATSYVEMENRQPVNIVHCDYSIIPFNQFGQLDNESYQEGQKLMYQSIDLVSHFYNVVEMQSVKAKQLYKKDFTWKANQQQIRAIVNQIFPK